MKVVIQVQTRVLDNPPGLATGKYIEVTTTVAAPVGLKEQWLFPPTSPTTSITIFGPITTDDLEQVRQQLMDTERMRVQQLYRNLISGC